MAKVELRIQMPYPANPAQRHQFPKMRYQVKNGRE
jgi:hypothetical protein